MKKFKKNLSQVLNTLENIMENAAFASKRANAPFSIFSNTSYFKGVQRCFYGVKGKYLRHRNLAILKD